MKIKLIYYYNNNQLKYSVNMIILYLYFLFNKIINTSTHNIVIT